jgi:hypothetical protein
MPQRHNRTAKGNDPAALAARLPNALKNFDGWYRPDGLGAYLAALAAQVAPHDPVPVMNAAGLSAAEWFRTMLSRDRVLTLKGRHHREDDAALDVGAVTRNRAEADA